MKKVVVLAIGLCLCLVGQNSFAFIGVTDYGETGWQTFSNTFDTREEALKVGVAVSNHTDSSFNSFLLIDNLSRGPAGNTGFELGNLTGYTSQGNVFATTDFDSSAGTIYSPTAGSYLAVLEPLGIDTSAFGGTDGSFLWLPEITFEVGDTFSFDWAFLAYDQVPYQDFAFLVAEQGGEIVHSEKLAQIMPEPEPEVEPYVIPEPASMLLLGLGLIGLVGGRIRKKFMG